MPDNILEIMKTALSGTSEPLFMSLMKDAGMNPSLAKATYTTQTGLQPFDLTAPSKNLYPVATPLRNRIPRRGGGEGLSTNWKQISGITGSGYNAMGWVPQGQRSGSMSVTEADKAATYVTLGEEASSTYEAQSAGVGFEDIRATQTLRMLQKMMLKEEAGIYGGNRTLALGTVGTVTTSASGSGTLVNATYSIICVALTYEGYFNSSLTNGVATQQVITGNDGQNYTLNGGSSMKSAAASQATSGTQNLLVSVAAVSGAMAYAWYVGSSVGAETLQSITTINSAVFSTPITTTHQNASAITADNSLNANLAFDGITTTAFKSGGYVNSLATGTAGVGTVLTASGEGTVNEIDTMLLNLWNSYQVSPDVIYVNAQQQKDITALCLTSSSGPLLRINKDADSQEYELTAGGMIKYYFNPYSLQGGNKIPIELHPNAVPGTIVGWTDRLPPQYQSNNTPVPVEMRTRREYYQIDWPITTRANYTGVYVEEVLAFYAPFAMGIISNIAAGH